MWNFFAVPMMCLTQKKKFFVEKKFFCALFDEKNRVFRDFSNGPGTFLIITVPHYFCLRFFSHSEGINWVMSTIENSSPLFCDFTAPPCSDFWGRPRKQFSRRLRETPLCRKLQQPPQVFTSGARPPTKKSDFLNFKISDAAGSFCPPPPRPE